MLHRIGSEEVALAKHIQVDLRMRPHEFNLTFWLDRNIRATHDDKHTWSHALGKFSEVETQGFVPDVVAQHQHIWRVVPKYIPKVVRVSKQAGLDFGNIPIHHGLDI